jgi:hypothetical protein
MSTRIVALLGSLAVLAGCSEMAGTPPSGFLGDYSQLQPGRGDQAQLVYINPEADFSRYERVLVEPVIVWERTAGADASAEELASLAADFGRALRKQLALEFELVENAGPNTLGIRTAITHVWESGASIELEIVDAESGQRMVAVADAKGDSAGPGYSAGSRASAIAAFEFWAHRASSRLAAFRSFDKSEAEYDLPTEP